VTAATPGPVLVMGAGAVGCWIGGMLRAAGVGVTFVARARVRDALRTHGLTLTDLEGGRVELAPDALEVVDAVPEGAAPALVVLAVKVGDTATAAATLAARLPAGTTVLSLQNGVDTAAIAAAAAPALRVHAGMVPFNVAEAAPGHVHRGTTGRLAVADAPALREWAPALARAGLPLTFHADMTPVLWGKLLLNLNNPVNALSGLPLRAQLLDRGYRRVLAALQDEALDALDAAGIVPAPPTPLPARRLPTLLRLPTPLFRLLAARMLRIDARAGSSMADDLRRGRPTEVDALCGAIVGLARRHGTQAPRNERIADLVRRWPDDPRPLSSAALSLAIGLA
jgi:2-dehydropantoate 2-reductase